jgi:hypothetical protein
MMQSELFGGQLGARGKSLSPTQCEVAAVGCCCHWVAKTCEGTSSRAAAISLGRSARATRRRRSNDATRCCRFHSAASARCPNGGKREDYSRPARRCPSPAQNYGGGIVRPRLRAIGELAATPRATLALRFGPELGLPSFGNCDKVYDSTLGDRAAVEG